MHLIEWMLYRHILSVRVFSWVLWTEKNRLTEPGVAECLSPHLNVVSKSFSLEYFTWTDYNHVSQNQSYHPIQKLYRRDLPWNIPRKTDYNHITWRDYNYVTWNHPYHPIRKLCPTDLPRNIPREQITTMSRETNYITPSKSCIQ